MKLDISLRSSADMATRDDFARMLRLIANLLESVPNMPVDSPLYDNTCMRVGTLTLTEEQHAAFLH